MRSLLVAYLAMIGLGDPVQAQKVPETCDREVRVTNPVILETPRGTASGRVCLDDGDSLTMGATWLRFKEFDAPNIGRNCLKKIGDLPPRCLRDAAAIEALPRLAALLDGGAHCRAEKVDNRNRWLADCRLPDGRSVARDMIAEGFGCATVEGSAFRSVDLEARRLKKGLWSDEWAEKRGQFPSSLCVINDRAFKRHLQYLDFKSRRQSDGAGGDDEKPAR